MSTLYVDSIQPKTTGGNVTITNQANAGKLLQVVQGIKVTSNAFTNTSYTNSDLSVDITPSATTSKILITVQFSSGHPTLNNATTYTIRRGTTNLDQSSGRDGFLSVGSSVSNNDKTYQTVPCMINFLDSPSTTSQVTYSLAYKMDGGTGYLNMNQNGDAGSKATCTIVAQEIGG
jgi:hypothetical protein